MNTDVLHTVVKFFAVGFVGALDAGVVDADRLVGGATVGVVVAVAWLEDTDHGFGVTDLPGLAVGMNDTGLARPRAEVAMGLGLDGTLGVALTAALGSADPTHTCGFGGVFAVGVAGTFGDALILLTFGLGRIGAVGIGGTLDNALTKGGVAFGFLWVFAVGIGLAFCFTLMGCFVAEGGSRLFGAVGVFEALNTDASLCFAARFVGVGAFGVVLAAGDGGDAFPLLATGVLWIFVFAFFVVLARGAVTVLADGFGGVLAIGVGDTLGGSGFAFIGPADGTGGVRTVYIGKALNTDFGVGIAFGEARVFAVGVGGATRRFGDTLSVVADGADGIFAVGVGLAFGGDGIADPVDADRFGGVGAI